MKIPKLSQPRPTVLQPQQVEDSRDEDFYEVDVKQVEKRVKYGNFLDTAP